MRDKLKSEQCSRYMKALADPERLRIIQVLQSGPKPVGAIARALGEEVANVSHHLGVLRESGLAASRREGRYVIYTLDPTIARQAADGDLAGTLDFGCCRVDLSGGEN